MEMEPRRGDGTSAVRSAAPPGLPSSYALPGGAPRCTPGYHPPRFAPPPPRGPLHLPRSRGLRFAPPRATIPRPSGAQGSVPEQKLPRVDQRPDDVLPPAALVGVLRQVLAHLLPLLRERRAG